MLLRALYDGFCNVVVHDSHVLLLERRLHYLKVKDTTRQARSVAWDLIQAYTTPVGSNSQQSGIQSSINKMADESSNSPWLKRRESKRVRQATGKSREGFGLY
jgi:hypothetical protein